MNRPDWTEWFLDLASVTAKRSACTRRQVGAVIVRDHRTVASGYNGMLPGEVECKDGGCPRANSEVAPGSQYAHGSGECNSIHGELNAVLDAARRGASVENCVLYITTDPCKTCERLVRQAGITRIVWPEGELSVDSKFE